MKTEKPENIIARHVPPAAAQYCILLWQRHSFDFRLRKSRVTKVGDFTARANRPPRVTVNKDLHPYMFLVTYIHEVAHVAAHNDYGHSVASHGKEWKAIFRDLLSPVLVDSVFPSDLLRALNSHMVDPRATTFSDGELTRIFRQYDPSSQSPTLSEIPEGSVFGLRGRWYRKGVTKRTRVLCQEVSTRKKYLVPADAAVENVQLRLL